MMKKQRPPQRKSVRENGLYAGSRPTVPRGSRRRSGQTCLALERLEPRHLLAAQPVITEFLARNDGGLKDGNGRSSDWIEIFNAGDAPVDLEGYHLTDDPQQLAQWTFPSANIDPGRYLVVYASGQDGSGLVDGDGNLHTNFTLRRGGDYLALVAPDNSVISEFGSSGEDFPEQLANVSYGIAQSTTLIDTGSDSLYLVPGGGNVDAVWTQRGFDAAANGFTPGTASLGFEARPDDRVNFNGQFETVVPEIAHAIYARFDFTLGDATEVANLSLRMKYDNAFVAYLNGVKVAEDNAPGNPAWFSVASSASRRDTEVLEFVQLDISEHAGALVDGHNVLAVHLLNHPDDKSDLLLVTELVAGASNMEAAFGTPARVGYLGSSTPGAANPSNDQVFSGFVADTKFTVDRGFYDSPQQVEIATETEGAVIHYTTNGSTPRPDNPSASIYAGPIAIGSTTTLRAAAFRDDFMPSNVDTQTYMFISDVVQQDFQAAVDAGFPETWGRIPAEYGLDPDVVGPNDLFGGKFASQLVDSLNAVPTISIVTDFENLYGPAGILENTQRSGLEWERPTSMELIQPDGSAGFQIDGGIRVQGDASRDYANAKKLSLRVAFRKQYGDTKLVYPLFGENATDEFDTVRLRANYNDGSVHTPRSTQQMRDEWMRRTLLDMGQPQPHGTFLHVYINGVYWGLYNVVERPDGSFSETYFGGDKDDWDTISASAAKNGSTESWRDLAAESQDVAEAADAEASNAAYQRLLGNNPDGTNNPELETLLDVDNYIDYLITNFYGGNGDWPGRNYYAGRLRGPESTGFKFFSWDAEKVLGHEEGATVNANLLGANSDVALFYARLRNNDEFRIRFADRVQRHFFNGGALYVDPENPDWDPAFPERNTPAARYDELSQLVELPLVAELARWGDTSRRSADKLPDGSDRLITPDDWAAFRDGLYADYFPRRSAIVLDQIRSAGLYPQTAAPDLNQHGGVVAKTFGIELSATDGAVYYTTDGSDPRAIGGEVSASARQFSEPLRLAEDTVLKARALQNGDWSALTEATFLIASDFPLRVTELNYNPHEANPVAGLIENQVGNDQFEFIEITNVGQQPVDLAGVRLVQTDVNGDDQGIGFTFAAQLLGAGERAVVVRDRGAFESRYGSSLRVAAGNDGDDGAEGEYGGRLSNNGEQLTLLDPSDQVIQQFTYPTAGRADGGGSSLEVVDTTSSYGDRANWRSSSEFGGSPGLAGVGSQTSVIVFNEVLANTDAPATDMVELFNNSARDVSLTGWYVSDTAEDYFKNRIVASATLPARGYHVLSEPELGFSLNGARGGELWLISADANGRPLQFVDHVEFPASAKGVSLGPWPTQDADLVPLSQTTFGGPNSGPRVGDVVISEVHYSPADPDGEGGLRVRDLEFIEVYNTSGAPVDLAGWRLSGDVEFAFPDGTAIAPGQSLVIVGFDPSEANKSSVFRFTYQVNQDIPLIGELSNPSSGVDRSGVVSDAGALIQLVRPGDPSTDDPDFVPPLVVDTMHYLPATPWPESPAGTGDSLTRTRPEDFGPFAISWVGATPTPGSTEFFERIAGDANDDGRFDQVDITRVLQSGKYLTGAPASWSEGDFTGDGLFDRLDVVAALQGGQYLLNPLAARRDWFTLLAADVNSAAEPTSVDEALRDDARF